MNKSTAILDAFLDPDWRNSSGRGGRWRWAGAGLVVEVLPVRADRLSLVETGEVEEVGRAVHLVVKLFRVGQHQLVLHVRVVTHAWKREDTCIIAQQHVSGWDGGGGVCVYVCVCARAYVCVLVVCVCVRAYVCVRVLCVCV